MLLSIGTHTFYRKDRRMVQLPNHKEVRGTMTPPLGANTRLSKENKDIQNVGCMV